MRRRTLRRARRGSAPFLVLLICVVASLAGHGLILAPGMGRLLQGAGGGTADLVSDTDVAEVEIVADPQPPEPEKLVAQLEEKTPPVEAALDRTRPATELPKPKVEPPKPKVEPPKPKVEPPKPRPEPPKPKVEPPKPKVEPPKPRPEPPREAPRPIKLRLERMKMVDQANPRPEPPPRDARYLAQDNRDVREETRARHTNLDRHHDQTQLSARPKDRVASLTRQDRTRARLPERTPEPRAGSARKAAPPRELPRVAPRPPQPAQEAQRQGILSMRGRTSAADAAVLAPDGRAGEVAARPRAEPARPAPAGRPGGPVARRRLKLELTPEDADRIYGAQWAAEWKRDNQRQGTRGPASKRWAEIKAGLENFVPEVKEGNQNALKTRAHPFARYIAAVHRRIHELWGFGFIEDLDRLPATDEFNDMSRLTKLEIVITRQGTIDKVGIVKPSGYLPFDVAAMDAVLSAGPFEAPPAVILSPNGKVYLHWRFARDHRQCGTFGVDAFILERAPGAPADRVKPATPGERAGEHLGRRPAPSPPERPAAPRPAEARPPASPMDADALAVAYAFVSAFQRGDAARIAAVADLPFSASGVVVARTPAELARMMTALVAETEQRRLERISGALTAAGLRSQLGSLPKGVRAGGAERFVVVRMDGADLVLILAPDHRGTMRLRGIAR